MGGQEFDRRMVRLNDDGLGLTRFENLPTGNYSVVRTDMADTVGKCTFTVAGFELAPLAATLGRFQLREQHFSCTLHLSRFSKPLDGKVRVELFDGQTRIDCRRVAARSGIAVVGLELEGKGPHHLVVVLVDDASATATIPLPGSERSLREESVLADCGLKTTASLLPGPNTTPALGLHLRQSESTESPIRLEDTLRGTVRIQAIQDLEDCVISTCPFSRGNVSNANDVESTQYRRVGNLAAGETVEIEVADEAGIVSVGCFIDKQPWESRAVYLQQCPWTPTTSICDSSVVGSPSLTAARDQFEPGTVVKVSIELGVDLSAHAAVVVRDARLQPSSKPEICLAARIKAAADDAKPGAVNPQYIYDPAYANHDAKAWIDQSTLDRLVDHGLINLNQADRVKHSNAESGKSYHRLLLENGYATEDEIAAAFAEIHRCEFVDPICIDIDEWVIECCPEAVARENTLIPIREDDDGRLVFAMPNPGDVETIEKLRFILNRQVDVAVATPAAILDTINRVYGQYSGETVDSMFREFADTAIDFTGTLESDLEAFEVASDSESDAPGPIRRHAGDQQPRTVYCNIVSCPGGRGQFEVELPDQLGRYTIDSFVIAGRQWSSVEQNFEIDSDPYLEFQLPTVLLGDDQARGKVVARCKSQEFSVEVNCNGDPVDLYEAKTPHQAVATDRLETSESEFSFVVGLGEYTARICDRVSGRCREISHTVAPMGKFVEPCRTLRVLSEGEQIALSEGIRRIRLLPNLQPIKQMVAEATADYCHLCCEQTAAKLLAAVACLANQIASGQQSEKSYSAVRAGLARMRALSLPGNGFAVYLGQPENIVWGEMATRHLLKIGLFEELLQSDSRAESLAGEIHQLAWKSARHYQIQWPPGSIRSSEDAYVCARMGSPNRKQLLEFARSYIGQPATGIMSFWRSDQAMAAATLLRSGTPSDTLAAIKLANHLLEHVTVDGRLYSTVDSVSLIVLLFEMSRFAWLESEQRLVVNGRPMPIADALKVQDAIRSIYVDNGQVPVECVSYRQVDWAKFDSNTAISATLNGGGQSGSSFPEGATIELRVRIELGYEAGDILWVALPPCLSRIQGGGQVKQFVVDFRGEPQVTIQLAATSPSSHPAGNGAPQHFIVCLRNMYDEQRIGTLASIPVQIV